MYRVAFITHYCTHYRVRTYEMLSAAHDVDFYFFSQGDEWYWQRQHGVQSGDFRHQYLRGFQLGRTRITPSLVPKLLTGNYDIFVKCINGRFVLPLVYLIARIRRKPFVLWTGIWMRLRTPAHWLLYPLTRFFYRHADAVVAYGTHVKSFLESEGVDSKKIFVCTHAIDNARYSVKVDSETINAIRQTLDVSAETKIVLYLGRLEPEKGIEYLIDAFSILRPADAVLVLAGFGSAKEQLEKRAAAAGIAHKLKFPGYIAVDATLPYYAAAWVFVLPSVTTPAFKEPWGLVVNEAMCQGVPVIATEAVGAAAGGLVVNGENGYVVPERNAQALADAIGRILGDMSLRERMGRAARARVAQWNNEGMVSAFSRAIEYAVSSKRRVS